MSKELATRADGTLDIQALAVKALAQGKDATDNLAAILALSERMEDRQRDAERKAAIASATAEFTPVQRKRATNNTKVNYDGTVKSGGYAKLEDIQEMVDPIFARHQLNCRWGYEVADGKSWLVFYVGHANGTEEERSRTEYMPDTSGSKSASQARGSGESYAMRYTMRMGLAVRFSDDCSEDDDGQAPTAPREELDDDQVMTLDAKIAESGADLKRFLRAFDADDLANIGAENYSRAVAMLNAKIRKAQQA